MVKFTFLEIHLEDSDFTANAPYGYGEKNIEAGDDPPSEPDDASRKGAAVAAVAGVVFLAVVAYLVKQRYLEEDEDEFEFDE